MKKEENKTLRGMVAELEENLEAYRNADHIINVWKLKYAYASPDKKLILLKEMLRLCSFSEEEIDKIISTNKL